MDTPMDTPKPMPLTPRQADVLEALEAMIREKGYPPTRRELRDRVGLKSTTSIQEYLRQLAQKGRLELDPSVTRGIRLLLSR